MIGFANDPVFEAFVTRWGPNLESSSEGSRWQRFSTETLELIRKSLEPAKARGNLQLEGELVLAEILGQLKSRKQSGTSVSDPI